MPLVHQPPLLHPGNVSIKHEWPAGSVIWIKLLWLPLEKLLSWKEAKFNPFHSCSFVNSVIYNKVGVMNSAKSLVKTRQHCLKSIWLIITAFFNWINSQVLSAIMLELISDWLEKGMPTIINSVGTKETLWSSSSCQSIIHWSDSLTFWLTINPQWVTENPEWSHNCSQNLRLSCAHIHVFHNSRRILHPPTLCLLKRTKGLRGKRGRRKEA